LGARLTTTFRSAPALWLSFALSFALGCSGDDRQSSLSLDGGADATSPQGVQADASFQDGNRDATASTAADVEAPDATAADVSPEAQDSSLDAGADASGACAQCIADLCNAELTTCSGDSDCSIFLACLDACPGAAVGAASDACMQACPADASISGAAAEQQLLACMTAATGSLCAACGADAESPSRAEQCPTPTSVVNPCDRCTQAYCCVENASCHGNPDCGDYLNCILPCTPGYSSNVSPLDAGPDEVDDEGGTDGAAPALSPGACEEACNQQYPNGRAAWAALAACTTVYCSGPGDCNGGSTACLQCATNQCAAEYIGDVGTSDGFALSFCLSGCAATDVICETACYEEFPGALGPVSVANQCALELCPACQPP
jgi:hypothetical protein